MQTRLDIDEAIGPPHVSTGHLPPAERVNALLAEAYERFKISDDGKVADYIPALARTPRNLFGLCVVETNGAIHTAGNTEYRFSIQTISKPFVFALVCQAIGAEPARERIGVNSTGLPLNSVMAIELSRVGVWRGGCRPNISVAAPLVWRCLTGSTVAPFPHPAHRTGHADFPHPALGQDITPLHV